MVAQSARCHLDQILLVRRIGMRVYPGMIIAGCRIDARSAGRPAGLGFVALVRVGLDIGGSIPGFVRGSLGVVLDEGVADRLASARFRMASSGRAPRGAAPHAGAPIGFSFRVAVGALLLVDQGLPIGNWNLVVIRVDFAERQKSMAVAAIVYERRLER